MKKMIMMAVASLVVVSAGAQNKDFQKQMKAASAYQEALGVLNSNLSGLSAEDKALGYNRLVDLAMDKFNKENNIKLTNQVTQKNDPFDNDQVFGGYFLDLLASCEGDEIVDGLLDWLSFFQRKKLLPHQGPIKRAGMVVIDFVPLLHRKIGLVFVIIVDREPSDPFRADFFDDGCGEEGFARATSPAD